MYRHETDKRFLFVMGILAEEFGQEAGEFKIKIYAKALEDIPVEDIERAAWDIIQTRTTASFPKVAEIRERLKGRTEDIAVIALDKLERAMARIGAYKSVQFDDPLIHACVSSLGGWPRLCQMDLDEWKWVKRDFEKIYRAFATRPLDSLQIPERLAGIAELSNDSHGFRDATPQIEYVGDKGAQPLLEGRGDERRTFDIAHKLSEKLGTEKG